MPFCCAAEQPSIEELEGKTAYEDGQKLESLAQWDEAAQAYKLASTKNPDQVDYKLKQATCYKHLQKWDEAIVCLSDAIALKPDCESYKAELAQVRLSKGCFLDHQGKIKEINGDLKGAIADYRAALEIMGDDNIIVSNDLTDALLLLGYDEDANFEILKRMSKSKAHANEYKRRSNDSMDQLYKLYDKVKLYQDNNSTQSANYRK